MAIQTKVGKAFEYALTVTLYNKINNGQNVKLEKNTQFQTAKSAFEGSSKLEQAKYLGSAKKAIDYVVKLEPLLENPISGEEITITIQSDQKGGIGDIRDVVATRKKLGWEIGFSAKNNHSAVKHSRLSDKIDFGKEWFGIPCSQDYMNNVKIVFGELRQLIKGSKVQGKTLMWKDIPKKKQKIYNQILDFFEKELSQIISKNKTAPELLLKYLIGKTDFYKIMSFKNRTLIQGFNLNNNLNQVSNSVHPATKITKLKLPTKIDAFERKRGTTLEVRFDGGWQLSLRIHNASSRVEPSLKFDIQLNGVPSSLFTHSEF